MRAVSIMLLTGTAVPALMLAAPASAETLTEALVSAYESNPRIDAERARLRATDEEVPMAISGYRPKVDGAADYGASDGESKPKSLGSVNRWGYEINVVQPIFRGFRTTSAVNEAEANVRAGRETLRQVESEILLESVTAYLDVVRDQTILRYQAYEHAPDNLWELRHGVGTQSEKPLRWPSHRVKKLCIESGSNAESR